MCCLVRNLLKMGWLGLMFSLAWAAPPQPLLPIQDLVVSVRQVDEPPSGYSVSTQAAPQLQAQMLRLRNGAQGTLQLTQTLPMLWTSSVSAQSTQLSATSGSLSSATGAGAGQGPGLQANSSGGSVSQSMTLMQAGQSLQVRPVWLGAGQPVQLEVAVSMQTVDQRQGGDLPAQHSQQYSSTVLAPLGQWVTLAASGQTDRVGVYGTHPSKIPRRLLQVRVSLQ